MKAQDFHGKSVIDSREVAEMIERSHNELMKSIRTYAKYLDEGEIPQIDFFIESTYADSQNREQPCYLITRKGCDMIANKVTGKKGVLFTAAYVTAFEDMKRELEAPHRPPEVSPAALARLRTGSYSVAAAPQRAALPDGVTFGSAVGFMRLTRQTMLGMGATPADVGLMIKETCEAINFPVPTALTKQLPGQTSFFGPALKR